MSIRSERDTLRGAYEAQKGVITKLTGSNKELLQFVKDLFTLHPALARAYTKTDAWGNRSYDFEYVRRLAESLVHVTNLSDSERENVDRYLHAVLDNYHDKEDA